MGKIVKDSECPACRETGHDSTGCHLIHYEDGGKWCGKAQYHLSGEPYYEPPEGKEHYEDDEDMDWKDYTPQQVKTLPLGADPKRKLSKETIEHFGVRAEYSKANGELDKVFYPYYNGKELGYKMRKHFEEGDREVKSRPERLGEFKCFRAVGNVKGSLFNQFKVPRGSKRVILTEGEEDALAAHEMLKAWNPKILSIPSGATVDKDGKGVLDKAIVENLDYLKSHKELILCFDQDAPGQAITSELARLIGPSVKVMKLEKKDASDVLCLGNPDGFVSAYFDAKPFTPVGIIEGSIGREKLRKPLEKGIYVPTLPGTMDKLKGLRGGELTLVLAPAGVGKTTIMREVGYALISQGKKIVHVFLEEGLDKTQQGYIALDNNVSVARYREDPYIVSDDDFEKSEEKYLEGQLWVNHWGSMRPKEVMDKFRYAASWGADFGILDHVSMVFSGTETTNERKEIDVLLTEMAAFTQESGMHLVVVSHIKRANRPFRKKEDYPYWETVASDAGRGSGAFEQLAHNIITLEVEYLDEDLNKGRIRTRVAKNREWSTLGVGDVLTYNMTTGRVSPEKKIGIHNY